MKLPALIRLATVADAQAINAILNHYVTSSTATFLTEPVSLEERIEWLKEHAGVYPVIVAEAQGAVIGWAALSSFRSRAAYRQTAEVSVYVEHNYHRKGVGRALLQELLRRAKALGYHSLIGGCCSESAASIALLDQFGFTRAAHFHEVGRKFARWLDVIFLELIL
jgi:phosphinothricin acetyltransferase